MRLPTGTLVVRIVERDAIARWRIDDDLAYVDAEGQRFAGNATRGAALPMVAGAPVLAGALPEGAREILDEIAKHAPLASDPGALTLHLPRLATDADGTLRDDPSGFVLQLGEEGPRAILGRRLLPQRVARLAALLDHDEETARTARLIDLRYADRAVLRTETAGTTRPNGSLSSSG